MLFNRKSAVLIVDPLHAFIPLQLKPHRPTSIVVAPRVVVKLSDSITAFA